MAVTITDHRTIVTEADSVTNWTSARGVTLFTSEPTPIESTGTIGSQISTQTDDIQFTGITNQDYSNKLIYIWSQNRAALDTLVNGGIGIFLNDGTNQASYHLAGSDASGFRYEEGPVTWQSHLLDTSNIPANTTTRAGGGAASMVYTSIDGIGVTFKTLAKSVGGSENCFVDIIRVGNPTLNNGAMITLRAGTSGDPITFSEWATSDRATGNQQAYGIIRRLGTGFFSLQGNFRIGVAAGATNTWFEDTNVAAQFEDRGLLTSRYGITIAQGTGTTTVNWGTKVGTGITANGTDGITFTTPAGVGAYFDAGTVGANADVNIYGSRFTGFTNNITLGNNQEFIGNDVVASGTVFPSSSLMYNTSIFATTTTSSLSWNYATDPDGFLDNMEFNGNGTAYYGIEFGPNAPATMSLDGIEFSGYGANSSSGAALYNNSGKDLQITILNSTATPTVTNAAGLFTTLIAGQVVVTVSGLVNNTEVRFLDSLTQTTLAGVENSSGSVDATLSSGQDVDIVIHNIEYEYIRINNFTVPANNTTLPIEQDFDRNYQNP